MRRGWIVAVLVFAAVLCTAAAGLRWVKASGAEMCSVCRRQVHEHSRTVALVNGRKVYYCCPTCALSKHHQAGKAVNVVELTDYATGRPLRPADAWMVRGSDVNPCLEKQALVDADRRLAPVGFDRCAPGLLAFANRGEAAGFIARHGGALERFSELAPAYAH